jgi:Protein kinase domain
MRNENDRHLSDRSFGRRPTFDSDLRHKKRAHHLYDYDADRRHSSKRPRTRSRSRSRSPFRHTHLEGRPGRGVNYDQSKLGDSAWNAQASRNGSRHRDKQSVSERSMPSGVALASKSNAKTSKNQSSQDGAKHTSFISADKYVLRNPYHHGAEPCNSSKADISSGIEQEISALPTVVDEAALIEERRKRREALKAKYRSQETPLLVQALHLGTDPNSPASSSVQTPELAEQSTVAEASTKTERQLPVDSAALLSPQTPGETPYSPAEINFGQDESLAISNLRSKVSSLKKSPGSTGSVAAAPDPEIQPPGKAVQGHKYRAQLNNAEDFAFASPSIVDWMQYAAADSPVEEFEDVAPALPPKDSEPSGLLAANEDEPSAADYDPTVDMQEERARHDKRLFNEDISISADEEKRILQLDESRPETSPVDSRPSELKQQKDPFDMFADDDDEVDMFADALPMPGKSSTTADMKIAQSLDVKMMDNWDDPEGYYMTIPGELFESRYHVLQNLGRGMFSSVVRATDTKTNKLVAIKIVRNNDTMRKAGIKEIEILKDLAANDREDKKHLIRLERSFEHKGHLCMVFENLSLNLREVLKKFGRDVGINLKAIRAYAQQLFLGLSLLRKCQYLHADLKPDNILVNDARNVLKICDLGSASSIEENVTAPYLVSRFYRAPEIILGIPYDYGIDVWSVGCTLFELYTGKILFTGRNNNAMLRSIMECRGKFPHKVLRKGNLTYQYFDDLLNFQSVEEDKLSGRTVTKMIDVKAKPVRGLRERLVPKGKRMDEQERKEVELFADLLDKCLDLRGDKRITPSEALRHPFIARGKV